MGAGRRRCATSRPHHTVSLERGRVIEELAGTVLQHAQNAVMAVDDDGRVGVYNPAAVVVHGHDRVLGVLQDGAGKLLDDAPSLQANCMVGPRRGAAASPSSHQTISTDGGEAFRLRYCCGT